MKRKKSTLLLFLFSFPFKSLQKMLESLDNDQKEEYLQWLKTYTVSLSCAAWWWRKTPPS